MDVYIGLNVKISVRILLWCHVAVLFSSAEFYQILIIIWEDCDFKQDSNLSLLSTLYKLIGIEFQGFPNLVTKIENYVINLPTV